MYDRPVVSGARTVVEGLRSQALDVCWRSGAEPVLRRLREGHRAPLTTMTMSLRREGDSAKRLREGVEPPPQGQAAGHGEVDVERRVGARL